MENNYVKVHIHTEFSNGTTNIDSVTKYKDYISRAKELGMKAIAFTEHGNIFGWYNKKNECEKNGLKYIHGVEAYVTENLNEKIRDNYHCLLYAKNFEGFKELNKLITKSYKRNDGHFYYTPRITFEELLNTSDNIIVSTACLGGILNKARDKKDLLQRFILFLANNRDRCFLEVQHHNVSDQIKYNKELYNLSKKTNVRLIAGTDTHCLNQSHVKGRNILQKSKNIHFSDEEGWDLTFKSYDELVESYKKQNSLPMDVVLDAIDNTNVLANMVEEFKIDTSYKYPKISKNPEKELKEKIMKGIQDRGIYKYDNYKSEYIPRINYELKTYKHNGAIDFLLLEEDIKSAARKKGVLPGYSRGSVSGSIIAYLLRITDMDSIKHKLNFERFMNIERISLADVDTDYDPTQRNIIKDYIYNKDGLYCADIITFNTVALKGSVRDVCRALFMNQAPQWLLDEMDSETQVYGKVTDETMKRFIYETQKKYLEIADYICENIELNEELMREEYPDVFEYVDIINGTIVSIGTHPCGTLVSSIPLDENIGLLTLSTNDYPVTMLNMKEVDSQNFVKLDILGLDNVRLINETCKLANIERLTPDNVDDNDENVWISIRDNTLGVFQWESDHARNYLRDLFSDKTLSKIKNTNKNFKYIDLFSVGNGAIRPAGASYRSELSQGEFRDNGHKALNELLSSTQGFLVYQEQILDFLHLFCGYTMGEADIVRRGFAKKTGTEEHMPRIKSGFIKTMKEKYGVDESKSEKIVENFIQVIQDASDYLFSLNHSQAYSYIGYICGYLRYYYPLEFLSVMLNINDGNIEKTSLIMDYMKQKNIKLNNPKFRYSKSEYYMDKETNSIFKGIESIKYLNREVGEYLYSLRDKKYNSFIELLDDIQGIVNSRQLNILIELDYFDEFGKSEKLTNIVELYNLIYKKKQFKKEDLPCSIELMRKYASTETDKMFKDVDKQGLCKEIEKQLEDNNLDIQRRIKSWIENTGSCNITDTTYPKRYSIVVDINTKYSTPRIKLYNIYSGKTAEVKISSKVWRECKLELFDLISVINIDRKPKRTKIDGKWVVTDELENWLVSYETL